MSKRLYVAYGSNLNIRQMKYRCPGAKLYGRGVIEDYLSSRPDGQRKESVAGTGYHCQGFVSLPQHS